jgi:elongation factor P--(R)-beta-lysine ligase
MDRPLFLRELEARRNLFEARAQYLFLVRDYFRSQGFLEVDAPILVPAAGMEPHLDPFEARGWATGATALLPTSPEFYLKKLLAAGVTRCFALAPSFRDEAPGRGHSPEFLMLEWYRAGETKEALLADCAGLLAELGARFLPDGTLVRDGVCCSFTSGLEVMSLSEAFERFAGADWRTFGSVEDWRAAARALGASGTSSWSENDCFSFLMVHAVEPRLAAVPRPVVLVGYPAFQAALARLNPVDPRMSERFELYAGGVEIANAYTELTHAGEQRTRFEAYQRDRAAAGKPPHPEDHQFMQAVEYLPPSAGIALGADRLLALLLDETVARVRHGC